MTSTTSQSSQISLLAAFRIQMRVVGALIMRELHTRYGRDNIGYLWLIGEPLMLGSAIALLHSGQKTHEGGIDPVAFTVIGYSIFIMFRGIVNRSEGALEANAPLLYHRMVTMFDIVFSRALLELAGTFLAFLVLITIIISLGYTQLPIRPLYVLAAIGLIFWISLAISLIITAITYDNPLIERIVHPLTYFMIPVSGAFYQVEWIPHPYQDALLYIPLVHIFEMARYGQFQAATYRYVDLQYVISWCLILSVIGLLMLNVVKNRIHLH